MALAQALVLIGYLVDDGVSWALYQAGHAALAEVGMRKDHFVVSRRKAFDGADLVAKFAADASLFDDLQSQVRESVEEL